MSDLAGTYDFRVDTPMGAQSGTLTVVPGADGRSFTGALEGGLGSIRAENGTIAGNTLRWTMRISSPMPMNLDCEASVDGDTASGTVDAGMFGRMPFTATRRPAN